MNNIKALTDTKMRRLQEESKKNGHPSKRNNGGSSKKMNVVNFDFDTRPSPNNKLLNESGRTTQATHSESTSSTTDEPPDTTPNNYSDLHKNNDGDVVGPLHHQYNAATNNNNEPLLHTQLSNNISTLHTSTQQAIQMSYVEQEQLSNDIYNVQFRISYLKRQIRLARRELIDNCGGGEEDNSNNMGDKLKRLSLVKDVDDLSDEEEDGGNNNNEKKKDATTNNHTLKIGSSSSHTNPDDESSDVVSAASPSPSIFRLTFGSGDMGMPSRWRNREMEREKTEQLARSKKSEGNINNNNNNLINGTAGDDDNDNDGAADSNKGAAVAAVTENTKQEQLTTLKQLVTNRESEISSLEKELMTVANEKSSLENEISIITNTMEQSKIETERERETLVGVIDVCQLDNRRLEKELIETNISVNVNRMNVELLGDELREARNMFIGIQKRKRKEREKYERRRRRGQRIDPSSQQEVNGECIEAAQSNEPLRVAKYQVPPANDNDMGTTQQQDATSECKSRYSRTSASLSSSVNTTGSLMSALTVDVSDLVDVLDDLVQEIDR